MGDGWQCTRFATSMIHEPDTTPCSEVVTVFQLKGRVGADKFEPSGVASGTTRK